MIRIYDELGTQYDLEEYGLECLSFEPESLSINYVREQIPGRGGILLIDDGTQPRNIPSSFAFKSADYPDYRLLQNEIYRLFDPRKLLYIEDKRDPGKRWKVRLDGLFTPVKVSRTMGTVDVNFLSPTSFSESIGTTLDDKSTESNLWSIANRLEAEEYKYIHNSKTFDIHNYGDVDIDPSEIPLEITFKGSSNNLSIKCKTTGVEWKYNGVTNPDDVIKLTGIRATKNSLSIFRNTNKKLLTIPTGKSQWEVTGISGSFEIKFDFRFYYL